MVSKWWQNLHFWMNKPFRKPPKWDDNGTRVKCSKWVNNRVTDETQQSDVSKNASVCNGYEAFNGH